MGKYLDYTKYVLEHKKNVFKTCWKRGLYVHAFTHDLSKFSPTEFTAYANWFNGDYGVKYKVTDDNLIDDGDILHDKAKEKFEIAWEHHYEHNKHHWNHWCYDWDAYYDDFVQDLKSCKLEVPKKMPFKHVKEMVCDWKGMAIKFGGSAQEYYLNHYYEIELNPETRWELELYLELVPKVDYLEEEYWMTIGDVYENIMKLHGEDPYRFTEPEDYINNLLYAEVNEKFNVNIYDIMYDAHKEEEEI